MASSLALTTACTVGGTVRAPCPSAPATAGISMPVVSMMKKGLPPARSAISIASTSSIRPPPACRAFARRALSQLAKAAADHLGVVPWPDAGDVADDRGRGRECRRVGLGARLTAKDQHRGADPGRELVGEPRLADAGLACDRDEDRPSRRARHAQALAEDCLLAGRSD